MIPIASGVRVWIATGHTDMRRGMQGLALQVQEQLKRDPHAGDLYIFRGRRGDLAKILWHDGVGLSLYAKRLDRGKFIWPSASEGIVSISAAQMAFMLEGIDWVRRETGRRQRVKVPYDEGVANHIDPESCVHGREAMGEALTGARVGQPLSDERLPIRSADAFQSAESNMTRRGSASVGRLRVVCRPWHAWCMRPRWRSDLYPSFGRDPEGAWDVQATTGSGPVVETPDLLRDREKRSE
jgi:transposase